MDEILAAMGAEQDEWKRICDEMIEAGLTPSAFDVSEEQRRRMAARREVSETESFVLAMEVMET